MDDDQPITADMRSPGDNKDEHPGGDHQSDRQDEHYRVTHPSDTDGVDGQEKTHPIQDLLSQLSEQTVFAPDDRVSVDQEQANVMEENDSIDDDYRPEQSERVNFGDIRDIDDFNEDDDEEEQNSPKQVAFKGQKNIREYDIHRPAEDVSQQTNRKVPVSPPSHATSPPSSDPTSSASTGSRRNPRRSARTRY